MQGTVEQDRGMAARQDKTVTIEPARMAWVKMQKAVPEGMHNRRHRHGRAWVPGVSLLHTVHRQRADGIYAQPVESCIDCHRHTSPGDKDKATRNQCHTTPFQERRLWCTLETKRSRE